MLNYEELFELEPFSLRESEKAVLYKKWLEELCNHHKALCEPYKKMVDVLGNSPALPVRLFKKFDLRSTEPGETAKTMTSSGTTGQSVSKIFLDRETSARQTKALTRIVSSFLGTARSPMLVIDSEATVRNRNTFSARGAGIRGFSMLGRDVTYALREDMSLDIDAITNFAERHQGEQVLLFGFTFMVWKFFCQPLQSSSIDIALEGVLIHGGGWKKLADEAVTNNEFKNAVFQACGVKHVHNYYGMVEQTGSIFMECEHGHLHASIFSDIEVLNPYTLEPLTTGRGVVKCISLLPTSYPGHILLTEDEGEILGVDDCPCGRMGRYFRIDGRMKGAEIRGCSDTYGS